MTDHAKGGSMAIVVITCPVTGKEADTGFVMDKVSFESSALSQNSFICPHCKKSRTWDKKDARLKDGN
jgi:hypothetical protein